MQGNKLIELINHDREWRDITKYADPRLTAAPSTYNDDTLASDHDLFRHSTIAGMECNNIDLDLPIIESTDYVHTQIEYNTRSVINSLVSIAHPCIPSVLSLGNFVVAGGSLRHAILGTNERANDIDMFIYGITDTGIALDHIARALTVIFEHATGRVEINAYTITAFVNPSRPLLHLVKIQFITRLYTTASQVIHGFDLPSSAVLFDGNDIFYTKLSCFCYIHRINPIIVERRSPTYESRLVKYASFFRIVMPHLDLVALQRIPLRADCSMPHFHFTVTKFQRNHVTATLQHHPTRHGYDTGFRDETSIGCKYIAFRANYMAIFQQEHPNLTTYIDVRQAMTFTRDTFDRAFNEMRSRMIESSRTTVINLLGEPMKIKNRLSPETRFRIRDVHMLRKKMDVYNGARKYDEHVQLLRDRYNDTISRATGDMTSFITDTLASMHSNIRWITENPGSQLTSSTNPVHCDVVDWYGFMLRCDAVTYIVHGARSTHDTCSTRGDKYLEHVRLHRVTAEISIPAAATEVCVIYDSDETTNIAIACDDITELLCITVACCSKLMRLSIQFKQWPPAHGIELKLIRCPKLTRIDISHDTSCIIRSVEANNQLRVYSPSHNNDIATYARERLSRIASNDTEALNAVLLTYNFDSRDINAELCGRLRHALGMLAQQCSTQWLLNYKKLLVVARKTKYGFVNNAIMAVLVRLV